MYEWEKGERIPMASLPEIAELFQTSTAYILHGVEPADTALEAIRRQLDEIAREQASQRDRLHDLHEALAAVAEDVAAAVEELARRRETPPAPRVDGSEPARAERA